MLLHRAMLCSPISISHVVIDVDGTLTDGGICYDATGNELKTFCTRDGAGLFAARRAGIALVVLTSRESVAVQRRAADFQVDILQQNVTGKRRWLLDFIRQLVPKPGLRLGRGRFRRRERTSTNRLLPPRTVGPRGFLCRDSSGRYSGVGRGRAPVSGAGRGAVPRLGLGVAPPPVRGTGRHLVLQTPSKFEYRRDGGAGTGFAFL